MAKLAVAFPQRDLTADDVALRGEAYLEVIANELSDAEWALAVRLAISEQRFFPAACELLDFGRRARVEIGSQPSPPRTEGEKAEARRLAAEALERIKALVVAAPRALPAGPTHAERAFAMPGGDGSVVVLTDERRQELRALALRAAEVTNVAEPAGGAR